VNLGKLPLRLREKNVEVMADKLQSARRKILEMIRSTSSSVVSDFAILTADRYKAKYQGKHPEEDGHVMFDKEIEGVIVSVCVVRVQANGEWRMENAEKASSQLREIVDDGENVIRVNQLDKKFAGLNKQISWTGDADIKTQEETQNAQIIPDTETPRASESCEEDEDEANNSDESEDTFMGTMLGVPVVAKQCKNPKAAANKQAA
jgi:hypothetical protein